MSNKTTLAIDGHIHIYPHYDLNYAINQGISNLLHYAQTRKELSNGKIIPMWLLVERHDCNIFDQMIEKVNDTYDSDKFSIKQGDEKESLLVRQNGETILYILEGRQLVTKENLEILSLVSTLFLKDRENAIDDVIDRVIESDGIPVINWAPGKWFFSRGEVVKKVLQKYAPDKLLIGDTSLRTTIWATPKMMAWAKRQGFKIIAGSDPLPFNGEEKQIGRYGFLVHGEFDETKPAKSVRNLLRNPKTTIQLIGRRNNPFVFFKRETKIMIG